MQTGRGTASQRRRIPQSSSGRDGLPAAAQEAAVTWVLFRQKEGPPPGSADHAESTQRAQPRFIVSSPVFSLQRSADVSVRFRSGILREDHGSAEPTHEEVHIYYGNV